MQNVRQPNFSVFSYGSVLHKKPSCQLLHEPSPVPKSDSLGFSAQFRLEDPISLNQLERKHTSACNTLLKALCTNGYAYIELPHGNCLREAETLFNNWEQKRSLYSRNIATLERYGRGFHSFYWPQKEETFRRGELSIDSRQLNGPYTKELNPYYLAAQELSHNILIALETALSLSNGELTRYLQDSENNVFKLLHWKPNVDIADNYQESLASHTDYDLFTLNIASTQRGYQIKKDGIWKDLPSKPHCVTVGDFLASLCNEKFKNSSDTLQALDHRSVNYGNERGAVLFFATPSTTLQQSDPILKKVPHPFH